MSESVNILALFDSHTPYLSFRLNAFCEDLKKRGLDDRIKVHVVWIGAEEKSYGWGGEKLQDLYQAPVHVLSDAFRGLGMKSFLHPSVPLCGWRLLKLLIQLRPRVCFVGGYDRPESILTTLLSKLWGGKTGVWNDSKFSDQESYARSSWLEWVKGRVVALYDFYMCPGRESVEYHRFLGGRNKVAFEGGWDVVDNESIARAAGDPTRDDEIYESFQLEKGTDFYYMPIRFIPKKNPDRVLQAYAQYRDAVGAEDTLPLVMSGKGPLEDEIRAKVEEFGLGDHIRIAPWLPYERVPRACRLSRAVLLASLHDQWGLIINEALASGTPVLASNRCGGHALIKNSVNGFTFEPRDVEHLAHLLTLMTEDQALVERMSAASEPSMESFSIRHFLETHFEILRMYNLIPQQI
ncbi:MAG: glycosyltransferase [Verrucomicrobiota bacterium]